MHIYEVRPRKDRRGFDLISDALLFVAIIFSTILLSSGCQKKTAARNPDSQSKNELNENTRALQAADLVGYDGTKLRKSVDNITKDNDKHNKEIENVIDEEKP
jgi:hypothetical protein